MFIPMYTSHVAHYMLARYLPDLFLAARRKVRRQTAPRRRQWLRDTGLPGTTPEWTPADTRSTPRSPQAPLPPLAAVSWREVFRLRLTKAAPSIVASSWSSKVLPTRSPPTRARLIAKHCRLWTVPRGARFAFWKDNSAV